MRPSLFSRVNGLQPQLHPHGLLPVQLCKQSNHIGGKAVRPGGCIQDSDVRAGQDGGKERAQIGDGGVGVGIGLKVGNVWAVLGHFSLHPRLGSPDLFFQALASGGGKIPGSALAAENAAAVSEGSVPVGAGHAAVQGQFVDLFSELAG